MAPQLLVGHGLPNHNLIKGGPLLLGHHSKQSVALCGLLLLAHSPPVTGGAPMPTFSTTCQWARPLAA